MSRNSIFILCAALFALGVIATVVGRAWPSATGSADVDGALTISVVMLIGLALVVALMAGLATIFWALQLGDKNQALGLPAGSVRALIAFVLVLAFVCFAAFLYGGSNAVEIDPGGRTMTGVDKQQIDELKAQFTVAYQIARSADGKPQMSEDGKTPLYNATYYSKGNKAAGDFAKQIFTTLATVFISVISFYFGSSTSLAAAVQATKILKSGGREADDVDQDGDPDDDDPKTPEGIEQRNANADRSDDTDATTKQSFPSRLQLASFDQNSLDAFDQSVVDACDAISISKASDIEVAYAGHASFFDWYNHAFKGVAAVKDRYPCPDTPIKRARFAAFWDQTQRVFGKKITALEFCALMAISLEEANGDMSAAPERMNGMSRPHPGLAYAFDVIPEAGKQSYNHSPNRTALSLFEDAAFKDAHGRKAGATRILKSLDQRWAGQSWPSNVPADVDPATNGFIMEADFYKFRGRGVIQTTWRDDYQLLLQWILSNDEAGANGALRQLRDHWMGIVPNGDVEEIATRSSNADWDSAFSEAITLAEGVAIDSMRKNKYLLSLSRDVETLQADKKTKGSLRYFAAHVNGGAYPNRVAPIMAALMCGVAANIGGAAVARRSRTPEIIEV